MRELDCYWQTNKDWYHEEEEGYFVVNDDAPQKAKDSYNRYLSQLEESFSENTKNFR